MSTHKEFTQEEATRIGESLGINWDSVNIEEFRIGIGVELEHGSHDPETNVIGDDPELAGKIAWAHLKELPDYYTRLEKMEAEGENSKTDEFKLKGSEIKQKVEDIIKEGNARRVIIKDDSGKTIFEIPLTYGVVGVVFAPALAAVGAFAALVTSCTLVVERK